MAERGLNMEEAQSSRQHTLPWMRSAVDITKFKDCHLHAIPFLSNKLITALEKQGFSHLLSVQIAVWLETIGPGGFARDLFVNSPTGSGKTLAYSLPIVQALSRRSFKCIRALIVLPTRDLAIQVKEVFESIAPSVGLSVGLAVGKSSLAKEISELITKPKTETSICYDLEAPSPPQSAIDILVATPGRLMDHITSTKGFTLQRLQYLVVDETDRLLREAYQSWLPAVLTSVTGRLVKMAFSATITKNPTKIGQLQLHHPLYMSTGQMRYKLPQNLHSYKLICEPNLKPLYLVSLLQTLSGEKTIVFSSSLEATHRLWVLLNLFSDLKFKIVEYSGLQRQSLRSKTLKGFRRGEIDVLVSSDAMTRGMDVEGVVNVVNYDIPGYIKTYVHRAGRTARAGQKGRCFTILSRDEVGRFNKMMKKAENSDCSEHTLPETVIESFRPSYESAFEEYKEFIDNEAIKKSKVASLTGKRKRKD